MSNCDWNRPCDCIDCRTVYESVICPACGFDNTVNIVREAYYTVDRKGVGGYTFVDPNGPIQDLPCYKCGHVIKDVLYDSINGDACQRTMNHLRAVEEGRVCAKCGKAEGDDFGRITIRPKDGALLCHGCHADMMKRELPNPSNDHEKYAFDRSRLQWILSKVKRPCEKCGKLRWLNLKNSWKRLCLKCFKAQAVRR